MKATRNLFFQTIAATVLFGCQPAAERVPITTLQERDTSHARQIADYPSAVDAIVSVLDSRFGLSVPRYTLEIYSTSEAFERGLVKYMGMDPALAQSTARFAKAGVGSGRVLINEPAIAEWSWPRRIEMLSHELVHTVQLQLANNRSLVRNQWLTEGFAEWMTFHVTDALGFEDVAHATERMISQVRQVRRQGGLPRLVHVDSLAQWSAARSKYGFQATYSLSFLVMDHLIERHSYQAVVNYFQLFRVSDDHVANFSAAFGESVDDFEADLEQHLALLLG